MPNILNTVWDSKHNGFFFLCSVSYVSPLSLKSKEIFQFSSSSCSGNDKRSLIFYMQKAIFYFWSIYYGTLLMVVLCIASKMSLSLMCSEMRLLEGDWIMGFLCSLVDGAVMSSYLNVLLGNGALLEELCQWGAFRRGHVFLPSSLFLTSWLVWVESSSPLVCPLFLTWNASWETVSQLNLSPLNYGHWAFYSTGETSGIFFT